MPFIQDGQDATANFARTTDYSGWANFPSAQAFGNNSYGQLGLNTVNAGYSSPVVISQSTYPSWIDAAYLRNGFGLGFVNQNGQPFFAGLAVSDTTSRSSPVQVGSSSWAQVSSGAIASIALQNNGTLWSWGNNSFGQLGSSNTTNRSSPAQVGALSTWTQVACGYNFSAAIQSPGSLWMWGNNSFGQLGVNTSTTGFLSPVQVGGLAAVWGSPGIGPVARFRASIQSNGTLWAWGNGARGALGNNSTTSQSSPVQVGTLSTWALVACGYQFTLAIQTPGTLWSWGANSFGQLGTNTSTLSNILSPVQVGAVSIWTRIACGDAHAMALTTLGTLWAWGDNVYGQVGNNSTSGQSSPIQIGGLSVWTQVACGNQFTSVIQSNGTLWSWGLNNSGQLGVNTTTFNILSPVQVGTSSAWTRVTCGYAQTLAIQSNGTLWAWGRNDFGQLGLNDTTNRSSPVQVGALSVWTQVTGGYRFTFAIQNNSTLWSWGNNSSGQLGLNDLTHRSSPVQVGTLSVWAQVACGYNSAYVRQTPGTLLSCGYNSTGQLGLGNTTNRSSPTQIGSNPLRQISCGYQHTAAIQTNGTLWSWGTNSFGQLGTNTSTLSNISSPVQVGAVSIWSQVSTGTRHTAAIQRIDQTNLQSIPGSLWAWGLNSFGQLGLNDTTNRSSPAQIGSLTTWTQVACGGSHTLARQTNGTLWAWGLNSQGQLGLNTTVGVSSPVQVGALSVWTNISANNFSSFAIGSPGNLWAWGNNTLGELGLNDTTNRSSPVQIGTVSAWINIASGQTFTTAIQNNATLWSWGSNTWGQLGLYNPAAYSITNYPSQFGTGNYNKVTASNSQSYFRRTVNNVVVQTSAADIPTIDASQTIGWNSYDTGQFHFVGVQSNGTAWSIGNNSFGQLGLNTTTSFSSSLTQIGSGTNWTRAIAADYGSMLINNSNVAWVFGKNNQYQLGLSDNTNRSSPVQITYATGIRNAAMDDFDIWLIDGNNNLWGGGIGNKVSANTTTNFTYPTQKFTSNFWNNVATNQDSTLLVGANSAIYGFGNNTFGQLGISANTNTYQFSPVQIGSINTTVKVETKVGSSIILFK
jgi:alpha-tubulin suppressor-like RCC1 family protein